MHKDQAQHCSRMNEYVVAGHPFTIFKGGTPDSRISLPMANAFTVGPGFTDHSILVAGGDVELLLVDLISGNSTSLCTFNLHGAVVELAMQPDSTQEGYVMAGTSVDGMTTWSVVKFDTTGNAI